MPDPSHHFPRACRLLRPEDFHRVFSHCRRYTGPLLAVLARQGPGTEGARLGLAISRKHARHAIQRNRIKRLVRESFRRHRHKLPNLDIIIMSRRGTAGADNAALLVALDGHWRALQREPCATPFA